MEIIIAKTAGFCFGVKRAVDMAFEYASSQGTYTYGPIIHNEVVIKSLEDKGIKPIETIGDEPVKNLIIRSHGVSPKVYIEGKEKGIAIVDATCPYVKKIHRYVQQYFEKGYGIIIAGNKDHPEIQGINGWANESCFIVKDKEALNELQLEHTNKKYLLVAQTTYKKQVVDEIVGVLKEKGIDFEYINTICNATKERQEEVIEIAKQVDVMLVLGSKKSSNSLKLFELSQRHCDKSYFIGDVSELMSELFSDCEKIGITAGASTPASVIQEVISFLEKITH
ncbi:4-hydroxy-3-methylbut-2-enyl diphosphate reductase [Cellulosilyticum sp. WCF-2]|uniref:4-hydroxy-3-methylbut-2-enyl diphosphate reductase n=1 Tax=Cellulosilyticum sp. WCF-2 TaxID=2497860 RepID=UPI000F8E8627|nr:4-hydroxy-3-methylbut-2-enyl diphosphate reductase [Cellulosilyticum sp. WCF-2]QEH69439.1 4-hydroxy-3-methylbut-2-enyl diphosphate reductase [Cellulosilyticum sp. WCF-2]